MISPSDFTEIMSLSIDVISSNKKSDSRRRTEDEYRQICEPTFRALCK